MDPKALITSAFGLKPDANISNKHEFYSWDNFKNKEKDFWKFKQFLGDALTRNEETALLEYNSFQEMSPIFHFITCFPWERVREEYMINLAVEQDAEVAMRMIAKGTCRLGYVGNIPDITCNDCRHIFMWTFIWKTLREYVIPPKDNKLTNDLRVVEIGGGYCNWLRLAEGVIPIETWTIIDIPYVTRLQKWICEQEGLTADIIGTDEYHTWYHEKGISRGSNKIELVIGAHSLSELGMNEFYMYLHTVLVHTRWLFYATHLSLPSAEIVNKKLNILERYFNKISEVKIMGDTVTNILYIRKA